MSRNRIVIFLSIAVLLTIGSLPISGQEKPDTLRERRITIQLNNRPIRDVFTRLMYFYDVPIGFEESTLDADHEDYFFQTLMPPDDKKGDFPNEPLKVSGGPTSITAHLISLDFRDARLEAVLDAIVKQMQNYDWAINNDVVNIYPINGRDPQFEKLLDLKIRGFGLSKGAQFSTIQPVLVIFLPEFKAFLAENKLFSESDRYIPSYADLSLPMELRFTDLTFKELLNGITRLKRGGWILRTDKHKKPENKGKKVIEVLI